MTLSQRFPAFIAYLLPIIGWLYVIIFQRKNHFARFHLKQSIGLFLFVIFVMAVWLVVLWLFALIPYAIICGIAFFTMVMLALTSALISWIMGINNALQGHVAYLPIFGKLAHRLPF